MRRSTLRRQYGPDYTRTIEGFSEFGDGAVPGTRALPNGGLLIVPAAVGSRGDEPSPSDMYSVKAADLRDALSAIGQNDPNILRGLFSTAHGFEQDSLMIELSEDKQTIKISPSSIMRRIFGAAQDLGKLRSLISTSERGISDESGFPPTKPGSIGRMAVMAATIANEAPSWAQKMSSHVEAPQGVKDAYRQWFLAATALNRRWARRLNADAPQGIRGILDTAARRYGATGDEVIAEIGLKRLPAANFLGIAPNLAPLQPGLEGVPLVYGAVIAVSAAAAIAAYRAPAILQEVRAMDVVDARREELERRWAAFESGKSGVNPVSDPIDTVIPEFKPAPDKSELTPGLVFGIVLAGGLLYWLRTRPSYVGATS
jgi:hypothetical protein